MQEKVDITEMKKAGVEAAEDREMGTKPILGLFTKYSLLTLAGMLAQVFMVIMEGIIIGRGLGETGLACVGLIMPLEYLMLALGGFFAIGISTMAAVRLGNQDSEGARMVYGQGLIFATGFMIILAILIFCFAPSVAVLLGAPAELTGSLILFIRIFMVGYPFCIIGHIAVYMARVDEKPMIATFALGGSAFAALIWLYTSVDILKLGIAGCAGYYASSIGLWGVFILYFIFSRKTIFKVRREDWKLNWKVMGEIAKIGFPYLIIQLSSTVFSIVINHFFGKYGSSTDIAAFAIINGYIIYILMMITQSAIGGMQPIASYNIGAGLLQRVRRLLQVSVIGNIVVVYAVAAVFFIFSRQVSFLFLGENSKLLDLSSGYARIILLGSGLGLTVNLLSGYFQAVEKPGISTLLGISRYLLFGIPMLFLCAHLFGGIGVWAGQPAADGLAFLLACVICFREMKRLAQS